MELIPISFDKIKAGMSILVTLKTRSNDLSRHTVSHTSAGHPGRLTIYCEKGFHFYENDFTEIFLDNAVNNTFILLEGNVDITDYNT